MNGLPSTKTKSSLPPAPGPGAPVTVSHDDLHDWLELRGLEIVGFDEAGRYFVQKKNTERKVSDGEGKVCRA
jgi:hypothetical protein